VQLSIPLPLKKAVYNYGVQLGNVLQMIVGSVSGGAAIKIISGFAPDLGKLLTKAAIAEGCYCFTAGTKVLPQLDTIISRILTYSQDFKSIERKIRD
jgi:hypothetical protein